MIRSAGLLALLTLGAVAGRGSAQSVPSLRELAAGRGILVGSMLRAPHLDRADDPEYAQFAGAQFSVITAPCYMSWLRPTRAEYKFAECDRLVAFAAEHSIEVRGHTLFWWNALPTWLPSLPDSALWDVLHQHVDSVVRRYRGKIKYWDVANELVDGRRPLSRGKAQFRQSTLWIARLGLGAIDSAFIWAHRADPDAKLFYNEAGIERGGGRAEAIVQMASYLVQRGLPINGVGLQFHLRQNTELQMDELRSALGRIAALGLDIQITELDVLIGHEGASPGELVAQAVQYKRVFELCLAVPRCTAVVTWGFSDQRQSRSSVTWTDEPLILDEAYRPKPALDSIRAVLGRHP